MEIVTTIVPIFIVIGIGWVASKKGFFSQSFIDQTNRLVYYLAIPAMVFNAIAKTDLKAQTNGAVIWICVAVLFAAALIAWLFAGIINVPEKSKGTFIQSAFHGNLGYIGFAVVYYYLGPQGLVKAAILSGFLMIVQNILAVLLLQKYRSSENIKFSMGMVIKNVVQNPVILSAIAGILYSLAGLELYTVIERVLEILKGMALPLALLIIGTSLSFEKFKSHVRLISIASLLKLILMPGLAFLLFSVLDIPKDVFLPAVIILAAPSATMTYVLAKEIGGDADLAGGVISFCTLLSGLTYMFWLTIV